MAVERSNPLPPNGRYWVDVSPEDQPAFTKWLTTYRGALHVVSTSRKGDGWDWVLFETTAPLVFWEGPGFPTIAGRDVRSENDVKQIPHVESAEEMLGSLAGQVGKGLVPIAIGLGALALVMVLRKR